MLSFARALGEYSATSMIAGYTPGRTATISTTVPTSSGGTGDRRNGYHRWVLVNIAISAAVLLTRQSPGARDRTARKRGWPFPLRRWSDVPSGGSGKDFWLLLSQGLALRRRAALLGLLEPRAAADP